MEIFKFDIFSKSRRDLGFYFFTPYLMIIWFTEPMRWRGLFLLTILSAMLLMISCANCKNGATNDCSEGGLDEVELLEKTRYVLQCYLV
jgi:hypothetical protein